MKKIILWTASISTLVIGLFFGIVWVSRVGLNYNTEGKYFDEASLVTYDTDTLVAYGFASLILIFLGVISLTMTSRLRKKI